MSVIANFINYTTRVMTAYYYVGKYIIFYRTHMTIQIFHGWLLLAVT